MKCNCVQIKLKTKNNIPLNNNKILELSKLSFGNKINLNYKKQESSHYLDINNYKIYMKKNIVKMKYRKLNPKAIKVIETTFSLNNKKRVKKIINNKEYDMNKNISTKSNNIFKCKIKFLDNAINLNYMFYNCKSLISVHFQNLNTNYLKSMISLFHGCSSLISIDDISYPKTNNINYLFYIKIKFLKI